MIVALAGRRIDADDAEEPHFPLANIDLVRGRLFELMKSQSATEIVCSAACGADLIALASAQRLGLRTKVILPFDRARFRETSVTDRPGDWAAVYDQTLNQVEASGNLLTLDGGYSAVNQAILDEAISTAKRLNQPAAAWLVWEGVSRGADDLTEEFGINARKRGLTVFEIKTI